MKLFNYVIEFKTSARWPFFSKPRLHKRPYYNHLVWHKFSLLYGQPHLESVRVCAKCLDEIQVISNGDECWDYCESCQQVEGKTIEITMEEYEGRL